MTLRHVLYGASILVTLAIANAQQTPQIIANCPGQTTAGTAVSAGFTLIGAGKAQFQWVLVSAPPGFMLNGATTTVSVAGTAPTTSGVYPVTVAVQIFGLTGQAVTIGPVSCSISVPPSVLPVQIAGACPAGTFSPGTPINIPLFAQGGSGSFAWRIDSGSGLKLSNTTGPATFVQGTTGFASMTISVTVTDTNADLSAPSTATFICTINVSTPPLTIGGACPTGPIAAGATVSIPLVASGGSGTYVWQINSGNSGLGLSTTSGGSSAIQGTAPGAGSYSFSVTLSDPVGRGSPATFTCSINVVAPLTVSGACPAQPIITGTAFTLPLTVSGGTAPYTWTVTGPFAPSATTGSAITLSGTPTTPGSFDISVTVQDSSGTPAATFKCTVRVVAPLSITGPPCPITNLVQGRPFSIPISGAGGTGNYTWSISGPSFLSLTSATGASTSLAGVSSSAGTFAFTVILSDDAKTPLSAPFNCSLQIAAPLTLQGVLPDGVVSQVYPSTQLNATGGIPPLTFNVSKGSLPPGLQLDQGTGTVSGTPTQAGTFAFTVTVTDSGSGDARQSASGDFQIRIVPQLMNTTACPLPAGRELQSYSALLTATGGTGQFTFSLAGSTLLPPGLVLNQNAITGTPQGPSSSTLSLQIVSGSQTITVSCQLTILGRLPAVTVNGFFVNFGSPLMTSSISLDAPVQQDVTGTAVLSFIPDVPNTAINDNPQVQFCGGNAGDPLCGAATKDSSGLLRMAPFTIPAGSTQELDLPPALQSNVAGTIQIALANVTMGGQSINALPLQFTIPRTPPQILSDPQVSFSGDALQMTLKVASSTCELTSASAIFTPAAGSELEGAGGGSLTESVDLTGLFKTFIPFATDATHPTGGCAFMLNLPFTVSGDNGAIARVDLTLKNTVGNAPVVTAALQP